VPAGATRRHPPEAKDAHEARAPLCESEADDPPSLLRGPSQPIDFAADESLLDQPLEFNGDLLDIDTDRVG
jgi:hypothetical protein